MQQYSAVIENFLSGLRDIEQQNHIAQTAEQEANDEQQDILHDIELVEHTYHEYARLAKDIVAVRKRRRDAKDVIAPTEIILTWMAANKPVITSLERLLGEVRKVERGLQTRSYIPRVRPMKIIAAKKERKDDNEI